MPDLEVPPLFQNVIGLGKPERVHQAAKLKRGCLFLFFVAICLLLAIVCFAAAFDRSVKVTPIMSIAAGCLFLIGVVYGSYIGLRRWNHIAVVYTDGLAYFNGRTILVFKWNEIASLTMHVVRTYYTFIPVAKSHEYTITHLNGKKIVLDDTFNKVEDLFDHIRRQSFQPILVRSCQAFDSGDLVRFGACALGALQGIQIGKKKFAWQDVGKISVEQGNVIVNPKKGGLFGGASAQVRQIPNLDVFLTMANEMIKSQSNP